MQATYERSATAPHAFTSSTHHFETLESAQCDVDICGLPTHDLPGAWIT